MGVCCPRQGHEVPDSPPSSVEESGRRKRSMSSSSSSVGSASGRRTRGDSSSARLQQNTATAVTSGGTFTTRTGPIRAPRRWIAEPPVTLEFLRQQREEFWDTRTEGDPEVWHTLRFVVECEDPEMQETVLESAGIVLDGQTLEFTYDSLGARYEIPNYVLTNPENLVPPAYEEDVGRGLPYADPAEDLQ